MKTPKNWSWLLLFTSTGTLLCCALPILLVTLGMGGVVASMASNLPFLVTLSQYKAWMFLGSGLLLIISGWVLYRPNRTCPSDPELGRLCQISYKWNIRFYWVSIAIWMIGFFSAYILSYLFA